MGLGALHTVSLAEARMQALECRKKCREGVDPIDERRASRISGISTVLTFRKCAEAYVSAHEAGWRNEKHVAQWRSTLETYAGPVIGDLPVDRIELSHILRIIEPIWTKKTETASRVRGRIESVLDWATVKSFRAGENPARWRGHLEALLPARSKVRKVQHHPALPYSELPTFMKRLSEQKGVAALALHFLILTAARTGEVIGATWPEIDIEKAVWIIPAHRMKAGREHRVPLSDRAIDILKAAGPKADGFVFQTQGGDGLSNAAMTALLKRMAYGHITAHGFRSTFRDWVAESTNYPRDMAEMALAHTIDNKV